MNRDVKKNRKVHFAADTKVTLGKRQRLHKSASSNKKQRTKVKISKCNELATRPKKSIKGFFVVPAKSSKLQGSTFRSNRIRSSRFPSKTTKDAEKDYNRTDLFEQSLPWSAMNNRRERSVMNTNIFLLLSKYGNELGNSLFCSSNTKTWSNDRFWYFCGIQKEGAPWNIGSQDSLERLLRSFLQREHLGISSLEVTRKLSDLHAEVNISHFIENEWVTYNAFRQQTLAFLGRNAFEQKVKQIREGTQTKAPFQGIVWNNNSCAYDSFLFVLYHVSITAVLENLFPEQLLGSSCLFHAPVAKLFGAFQLLEEKVGVSPENSSNWIRGLAAETVIDAFSKEHTSLNQILWSPFSSANSFCDLYSVYSSLSVFFGSHSIAFKKIEKPNVYEVPQYYTGKAVLNSYNSGDRNSICQILFSAVCSFADSIGSFNQGIYVLTTAFSPPVLPHNVLSWYQSTFLRRWGGIFQKPGSSGVKWVLKLMAVSTTSRHDSDHFVSATCHYYPHNTFFFHDGLEAAGTVREIPAELLIPGKLDVNHAVLVVMLRPLRLS